MALTVDKNAGYHSEQRIIQAVRALRCLSRKEIANVTGFSIPSVTRLVNELIEAGTLTATQGSPDDEAGPGRPAETISLNPSQGLFAGVDVGEHIIRVQIGDLRGDIKASHQAPTQAERGRETTLRVIEMLINKVLTDLKSEVHSSTTPLRAITLGIPGTVDELADLVLDAPNIKGWQNYPLRRGVADLFPDTLVRVENDVNLAAVGESAYGVAKDRSNFVFASFRRGIGAGIFINGELYRGGTGFAGELGFMAFGNKFDIKTAGGLGHLETLASEQPLSERAYEKGFTFSSDGAFRELCIAANEGDPIALEIIADALEFYGVAVANVSSLLNPDLVVIGGSLSLIASRAVEKISETVCRLTPHPPQIEASQLGENATLKGAFYQAHVDACVTLTSRVTL